VFFIRHGQTAEEVDKKPQLPETPLNETGKEEMRQVAKRLKQL
jgi:broad specificity phosphatase PhoE